MEDQQTKSGIFYTNQKGQLPPLVTTDFITVDQGNASPRFMRSTMYNVPVNSDMMKQVKYMAWLYEVLLRSERLMLHGTLVASEPSNCGVHFQAAVPFALVISPMAELLEEEHPPPLVDFGELGPVRCIRCKAYMCPNMQFFDGGRRFVCLLCKASTEGKPFFHTPCWFLIEPTSSMNFFFAFSVPGEYFQHLDHTGLRTDRYERAELMLGAYDIIATKEYCRVSTVE